MLTLEQALQHGAAVGVKYYVKNSYDKIVGGICTEEQALSMKKRFEEEDKHNPWTKGSKSPLTLKRKRKRLCFPMRSIF